MKMIDRTLGCLLGLALGDAYLAPFEGGLPERLLWRVIGKTRRGELRWTDDTQMSIDICESYLACGTIDPDDLARRFARSYRWSRGYGPGAAKVLRRIARGQDWRVASRSVRSGGSYGNGAAMRAPAIGVIYANRPSELTAVATTSAIVTHAHPLAVEGAVLVATVTASVLAGRTLADALMEAGATASHSEYASRTKIAEKWLKSGIEVGPREVDRGLGNGIAAHESSVTAIFLASKFQERPFQELHRFIAKCGGDTDTIGAMAGAIWGAANGVAALPADWLDKLEQRDRIEGLATSLHDRIFDS
jgi:ADP-ribosylglycohydrolase